MVTSEGNRPWPIATSTLVQNSIPQWALNTVGVTSKLVFSYGAPGSKKPGAIPSSFKSIVDCNASLQTILDAAVETNDFYYPEVSNTSALAVKKQCCRALRTNLINENYISINAQTHQEQAKITSSYTIVTGESALVAELRQKNKELEQKLAKSRLTGSKSKAAASRSDPSTKQGRKRKRQDSISTGNEAGNELIGEAKRKADLKDITSKKENASIIEDLQAGACSVKVLTCRRKGNVLDVSLSGKVRRTGSTASADLSFRTIKAKGSFVVNVCPILKLAGISSTVTIAAMARVFDDKVLLEHSNGLYMTVGWFKIVAELCNVRKTLKDVIDELETAEKQSA